MRTIVLVTAAGSLVAASPEIAEACSPTLCPAGFLTPGHGASVPANLPSIQWDPMFSTGAMPADPSNLVLASAAAPGTPLPFTATLLPDGDYRIVPDQPLTPGMTYRLEDRSLCHNLLGPSATYQVAEAAPPPASLGRLVKTRDLTGPIEGRPCPMEELEAHQIEVALELAPEAIAWRDALHFETLVDGQVWRPAPTIAGEWPPGASWRGRGLDRVYLVCKTSGGNWGGLEAGPHEVVMRATLPGTPLLVESSPLTVELTCEDPPGEPGGTGGGCDAGGARSSGWLLLGALAGLAGLRRRARADPEDRARARGADSILASPADRA